jgi:hypothetical protein
MHSAADHYRRYDGHTATMLGAGAGLCGERWRGDLRRLHTGADGDVRPLRGLPMEFPGIGPTGADIFLREVQGVSTEIRAIHRPEVTTGAKRVNLPSAAGQPRAARRFGRRLPGWPLRW